MSFEFPKPTSTRVNEFQSGYHHRFELLSRYKRERLERIWGEKTLEQLAQYYKLAKEQGLSQEEIDAKRSDMLKPLKEWLEKIHESQKYHDRAVEFLVAPFEEDNVLQVAKQELKAGSEVREMIEDVERGRLLPELFEAALDGYYDEVDRLDIPDKLFEAFVSYHVKRFRKENEAPIKNEIPGLKRRFRKRCFEAISGLQLPLQKEVVSRRLRETRVIVKDGLFMLEGHLGRFDVDNGVITISGWNDTLNELELTFTHEMMHVLSGRLIWEIKDRYEDAETKLLYAIFGSKAQSVEYEHRRIGVVFSTSKKFRFFWLNEALTASLTDDVIKRPFDVSYPSERKLLSLLESKIPRPLFLAAYFENFDPEKPADQRIPHWNALIKKITESYGSGFLVKLDKFVQEKGVDEAVKIMELPEGWRQIQGMYA